MGKKTYLYIFGFFLVFILRGSAIGQKRIQVPNGEVVLLGEKDVRINPYYVHFKNMTEADGFFGNGSYWFLAKDTLGYLWFWHEQEGLFRYNGLTTKKYGEAEGCLGRDMRQAAKDKAGNLWFAATNGLWQFDIKTGHFAVFSNTLTGDKNFGGINALPDGTFWISTSGRNSTTWVFDPQKKQFISRLSITFTHVENNRIDSAKFLYVNGPVYMDRDSFAWVRCLPSGPGGFYLIDLRHNTGKGYEMSKKYWQDGIHPEKLEIKGATVVFADSDSIHFWLGSWLGGLSRYNKKTGFWTQYTAANQQVNNFNTETILSIGQKSADELVINGYAIFNKKTETYDVFPPDTKLPFSYRTDTETLQIKPDGYQGYWAAGRGVTHYSPSAQRFMMRTLPIIGAVSGLGCYDTAHNNLLLPFGGLEKNSAPSIVRYNDITKKVEQKFYPELLKNGGIDHNIIKILASKKKKAAIGYLHLMNYMNSITLIQF